MKKCLFVIFNYGSGGAEHILLNILKYNSALKTSWNIDVFGSESSGVLKEEFSKYANIVEFPLSRLPFIGSILKRIVFNSKFLINKLVFDKKSYDFCIAYLEGGPAKIVSNINNASKKIAWIHTDINCFSNGAKKKYEKVYNQYKDIAFVSQDTKLKFLEVYPKFSDKRLLVLHNPIDFEEIKRKSLLKCDITFEKKENVFRVVTVGRFSKEKAMERVVDIAQLVHNKNMEFFLIGTGVEFEKISNKIERLGLRNIKLFGYISNPYPYIKKADIYLLPSKREGYPTCLCEALALSKPIIASDCTGTTEVLGEAGMIFPNDDTFVSNVCNYLEKISTNSDLYQALTKKSIERALDFNYKNKMKEIRNFIEE